VSLLQHQHGTPREAQLAGENQADGTCAGDDNIINGGGRGVHKLLLGRCPTGAFLRLEYLTDEHMGARSASDVRRGDLVHEAKDQSFRYRKDLGLPNQVCLFRRVPHIAAAIDPQWEDDQEDRVIG
jgi:hypothetical protein